MHQDKKRAELEEIKEFAKEAEFEMEIEKEDEEKTEEIKITEGEIETGEVLEKKKRREAIFELALFLILGILLGITIKTEAVKKITIGFNDYQINTKVQRYDVSAMKKELDDQMAEQQKAAEQSAAEQGVQTQPQQ